MITGHIVTYDNMGIAALIHPLACTAATPVGDCDVTHHLIHGTVEGHQGQGAYIACMREDDTGPWIKLVPKGQDAGTAHEIKDLLDAFIAESGDEGRHAILEWIVADERAVFAAEVR